MLGGRGRLTGRRRRRGGFTQRCRDHNGRRNEFRRARLLLGRARLLHLDRRGALEIERLRLGSPLIASGLRTDALAGAFRAAGHLTGIPTTATATAARTTASAFAFGAFRTILTRSVCSRLAAAGGNARRHLLDDRRQRNRRGDRLALLRRARGLLGPRRLVLAWLLRTLMLAFGAPITRALSLAFAWAALRR